MPAYVLVEVEVLDAPAFERYREIAPPIIAAYGGRYLARGGRSETLEGDPCHRMVVLEFPSLERAREWWASEEYAAARSIRSLSARVRMIAVEGV